MSDQPDVRVDGAQLWADPITVTEEQFEQIRQHFDSRARDKYGPEDVFGYRLIASSDGVDSYFTRTDRATSMENYVRDLQRGQSVLGNHSVGTFSYGSSYDGEVIKADPDRAEYEATFYSRYADRDDLKAEHWVVGDYYMIRGVQLNNQPTDDLIRAIEMGAVKKASISFTVGRYVCGLDGTPYVRGWFGMVPDEDEGCTHFPGLEYQMGDGAKRLAYAVMEDNDLLETSWVYKNASPGAMLLRRAEALAKIGALDSRQVATIEERYQVRLPAREQSVFQAGPPTEDRHMSDQNKGTAPPAEPVDSADPQEGQEPEDRAPDQRDQLIADFTAREAALTEANDGKTVTAEVLTDLRERAAIGDELFARRVKEAVQSKVRVHGNDFDAGRYERHLTGTRDIEYVEDEKATWDALAERELRAGRQVPPADPPTTPKNQPAQGARSLLGSKKEA
jgi:hypothetical protein